MKQLSMSRRKFVQCSACAVLAAPFVLRRRYRLFADSTEEYPERVVRLVRESLVIDMLNQFLYRTDKQDLLSEWLTRPGAFTRSDFEFFINSGVNAINFGSAVVSLNEAEKLFAKWNSFLLEYPQWLLRVNSVNDFERVKNEGRYGIIFGLQSSAQFETVDAVDTCYGYGQRISQLSGRADFPSTMATGVRRAKIKESRAKSADSFRTTFRDRKFRTCAQRWRERTGPFETGFTSTDSGSQAEDLETRAYNPTCFPHKIGGSDGT